MKNSPGAVQPDKRLPCCTPAGYFFNNLGHQIAWLEQELLEVEAQEGLAVLIGHYTPVNCQHEYGVRFRALMERFQNVIRFDVVGHTHMESY